MGTIASILAAFPAAYVVASLVAATLLMRTTRGVPAGLDVPTAFRFGTFALAWPWMVGPARQV